MLKFRCQHCGQRIAVPARHLGKLVTCAECGQVTHPLAEQLARAKAAAMSVPVLTPAPGHPVTAPCGNCGNAIGVLQAAHLWRDQRVCDPCYHALSAESSHPSARAVATIATRVAPPAPVETPPRSPTLPVRERLMRTIMVFVVAVVALYGALTLLRDIAGLIAVAAVAVLALLALYAVVRAKLGARTKVERGALTAP